MGSVSSRAVRQAHDASNGAGQSRGTKSRDDKSSGPDPEQRRRIERDNQLQRAVDLMKAIKVYNKL